jgi:hypothetical protein
VPVGSIFIHSTVAVPKVYTLGQRSKLAAIDSFGFETTPELLSDVAEGSVFNIQGNYTKLIEADILPDVFLMENYDMRQRDGAATPCLQSAASSTPTPVKPLLSGVRSSSKSGHPLILSLHF